VFLGYSLTIELVVKCSARIAREEDERELKLLEEEERRERLKKNRKLSR
jgi:protein SPT2